jgi:3-oxoadipate enol-lactonase
MFVIKASFLILAASLTIAAPMRAQSEPRASSSAPGSFVDVENGKLYYEECGTGPEAVVLLHDGIAHSVVWNAVWPDFCKKYHTVRYDRRGFGRSPVPTSIYSETEDLAALLHSRKIDHAILVGSSHGGELSIDFTLQYPQLVRQLVLVGPVLSGFPYSDFFYQRGVANSKPFEKDDVSGAISNWSKDKYLLAPGHEAARKKLLEILTASPQDLTHPDLVPPSRPALGHLPDIRVATLILVGDSDIADVFVHAGAIEAGIFNSQLVVVPQTGHLMYLEKPEEFSRIVLHFIDSHAN